MEDNVIWTWERGNQLLKEFGLKEQGWTFDFDGGKQRVGACHYNTKKITYSRHYLNSPREDIEDVLRHEVAHALAGYEAGHGPHWKRIAISCGARPERCSAPTVVNTARPNYKLVCEFCGREWKRY